MTAVTDQDQEQDQHQDHTERSEQSEDAEASGTAERPEGSDLSEDARGVVGQEQEGREQGPYGDDKYRDHLYRDDDAYEEDEGDEEEDDGGAPDDRAAAQASWADGLIARRVGDTAGTGTGKGTGRRAGAGVGTRTEPGTGAGFDFGFGAESYAALEARASTPQTMASVTSLAYDAPLTSRLEALRELVGLSRARLDSRTLAGASRVLDEAAARRRLSGQHTVVAIAGATGSGKSQLFNVLAGATISETGVRRPTTAAPIACSWSDGAAGLIERLGIPPRLRRRPLQATADADEQLRGLVLIDLPDHDSAAVQHREQVDRVLGLVDAVIWVVDPEKYADAMLHERYLRPMAAHAEVMFVVLNQIDRLPGDVPALPAPPFHRVPALISTPAAALNRPQPAGA
ncbi:YfjP family GTPase, partial [Streptomyces hirsutus]|uniref:YfjP family GTPase n=1 Tax=Streptomyces hirsutus TaxID=35620 RepID=UPI0033CC620E